MALSDIPALARRAIRDLMQERIAKQQDTLERVNLDERASDVIRGRIAEARELLKILDPTDAELARRNPEGPTRPIY